MRNRNIIPRMLALFALIVQLAVTFGHVHAHADDKLVAAGAQCLGSAQGPCAPPVQDEDDERDCPICQAMSLVSSAVLPLPATLTTPVAIKADSETLHAVQITVFAAPQNFQARGPPRV